MRNELLVAIVTGILFGVVVAFGIWKANTTLNAKATSPVTTQVLSQTETASPTPTPAQKLEIELISPLSEDVVTQKTTTISGITQSKIWVSVASGNSYQLVKSHDDGTFKATLDLLPGIHQVLISAFDSEGKTIEKVATIVSSPTFATASPAPKDQHPKAYIGVITDKTENSLQIKDQRGTILLISLNPETIKVAKVTDTQKDASYSDIAIGDHIAALGYVKPNDVLDTAQILLAEAPKKLATRAVYGNVTDITSKNVTVSSKDGSNYIVEPGKTVVVTQGDTQVKSTFTEVDSDQTIIAVGSASGLSIVPDRIHIVQ